MKHLLAASAAFALAGVMAAPALGAPALDPAAAIAKSTQALGRTIGGHRLTTATVRCSRWQIIAASRWLSALSIPPAARCVRRPPSTLSMR